MGLSCMLHKSVLHACVQTWTWGKFGLHVESATKVAPSGVAHVAQLVSSERERGALERRQPLQGTPLCFTARWPLCPLEPGQTPTPGPTALAHVRASPPMTAAPAAAPPCVTLLKPAAAVLTQSMPHTLACLTESAYCAAQPRFIALRAPLCF